MVDMAHFAGLVAAGEHPNPVPHADVVTSTVHKTLGGARGGVILCKEEHAKKINSAVFPGQQGGPLEHVIAGKAVAFKIAAQRGVPRAPAAHRRGRQGAGRGAARTPATASTCSPAAPTCTSSSSTCASPSSTASRPRTACTTSGSRSTATPSRSTPARRWSRAACASARSALATRGLQVEDFPRSGEIIATALDPGVRGPQGRARRARATAIAERHPLYEHLGRAAATV